MNFQSVRLILLFTFFSEAGNVMINKLAELHEHLSVVLIGHVPGRVDGRTHASGVGQATRVAPVKIKGRAAWQKEP